MRNKKQTTSNKQKQNPHLLIGYHTRPSSLKTYKKLNIFRFQFISMDKNLTN